MTKSCNCELESAAFAAIAEAIESFESNIESTSGPDKTEALTRAFSLYMFAVAGDENTFTAYRIMQSAMIAASIEYAQISDEAEND